MVVIYAAFLGLLLASYVPPLQDILHNRAEIPVLEQRLQKARTQNIANERLIRELQTPPASSVPPASATGWSGPARRFTLFLRNRYQPSGKRMRNTPVR